MTRTGTAVKRFQTELISVRSGSNLGFGRLPFAILKIEIPAMMIRKTTASATAMPDVTLSESANNIRRSLALGYKVKR